MSDSGIEITLDTKKIQKAFQKSFEILKDFKPALRVARQVLLHAIDENFETEGVSSGNKYQDWSDYYKKVRQKIGGKILHLDGVLRKSITGIVRKDSVIISTEKEYAAVHNFGFEGPDKNGRMMNMPQREFFRLTEYDWMNLEDEIMQNIAKRLEKQNEWD